MAELVPSSGPELGGTLVTVNGAGFQISHLCVCRFGHQIAPSVSFISSTRLQCIAPPGVGTVRIDIALNGQNYVAGTANLDFSFRGTCSCCIDALRVAMIHSLQYYRTVY